MKFGIVTFPGSNCDFDMHYILGDVLGHDTVQLWHKSHSLQNVDMVILPGGFSYGDYLRSGAIARFSPIMQEVIEFADKGGYVFGICNGFQILCESHLLPGALMHNDSRKFICKNVHLKTITDKSIITSSLKKEQVVKIPIAHGEGKYFADENVLSDLIKNDQILFKYCDENGNINEASNPNGAILNIAGICNKKRNVFGMMPHPERCADNYNGNKDGLSIFKGILSLAD
jgi:phosphoribosylformylglycinamidine synthase